MFDVSGSTWVPQSTYQHALSMLTAINGFLSPLGITLKASMVNVIWWVCLGLGALAAAYDQNLALAEASLDPTQCADAQIPNLMIIAGISPIPGSYSTLEVQFTGDATGQTVPAGTHVKILNQTELFVTDEDVVVPALGTATVSATSDTIGAILVLSGQVSGTVETLSHITNVTNLSAAIAGSDPETVTHQRTRLVNGQTLTNTVNGLATQLRSLSGIQYANVYFNPSPSAPLSLPGGISLPARTMYMVVMGASDKIAETYAALTLCPTYGSQSQNFVSNSGQTFPVHYDNATTTPVYVKVYISATLTYQLGYLIEIQNLIMDLAGSVTIGQSITAEFVALALANFTYATVNGVEVSLDGVTYGRVAVIGANSIATFAAAHIIGVTE